MGLDIRVFKNAKFVSDNDGDREDLAYVYTLEGHEARIRDMKRGYYEAEEVMSFRAGSYSGYNHWRNLLALAIHDMPAEEIWEQASGLEKVAAEGMGMPPFFELINFADNEGCIGPSVSKKLYKDFCEHEAKFTAYIKNKVEPDIVDWDLGKYQEWKEAFRLASENGFVSFN